MLNVTVICVGKLKEKFYIDASSEYVKRLSTLCKLNIIELNEEKLTNDNLIFTCLEKEKNLILSKIPNSAYIIPLCIEGKLLSSEEMASKIADISQINSKICFIIGSSHGLNEEIKAMGNFKLSMSKMTFPHHFARIMLLEQIYRSFSIISGGKYHK